MDDTIVEAAAIVACIAGFLLLCRRKERENWCDPFLEHKDLSEYHIVMQQLRENNDRRRFKKFIRVSPEMFDNIVRRVGPRIERKNTNFRPAIPVEQRVAIALRFVATGDCYQQLEYHFRVIIF